MEVAPFFVDFHHFLSIFTIFYRFSRFTHFCRDLHFVAIYSLFPQFFLAKIAISATSHVFCMYAYNPLFLKHIIWIYGSQLSTRGLVSAIWSCLYLIRPKSPLFIEKDNRRIMPGVPSIFSFPILICKILLHNSMSRSRITPGGQPCSA